jgi:hypothetical protein
MRIPAHAALERMIALRVAKRSDCLYAWRQNVVVAHSVGVTDEQIAALGNGDISASCFSDGSDRGDRQNLRGSQAALLRPGAD